MLEESFFYNTVLFYMGHSKFTNAKITGISACVPKNAISIYDEARFYSNNAKKIDRMRKMLGVNMRRVVKSDKTTPSDMAICAAKKLIGDMKINAAEIDALIYVAQNPDFIQPATSMYIHKKLGLPDSCMAFDMTHGCPGWVYGLHNAHCLVQSNAAKKVLLLTADTPSTKIELHDRQTAPIFGDAASATFIERVEDETPSYFELGADGKGYSAIITPAGAARFPLKFKEGSAELSEESKRLLEKIPTPSSYASDMCKKYMNGIEVFNFTITKVPERIKDLMSFANIAPETVDRLFLHQANSQIVAAVTEAAGFPKEKSSSKTFEEFGNETISSIPVSICHIFSEEARSKKSGILCAGFGIGLAWGVCAISLDSVCCPGVIEFEEPKTPDAEDTVEYWQNKISGKNP